MPYIATAKVPYIWQGNGPNPNAGTTRRAVATLDEAQAYVWTFARRGKAWREACGDGLPESGGTVGPLPDGTVIKVEPIHREMLAAEAGYPRAAFVSTADLVDAYNAAQGTR